MILVNRNSKIVLDVLRAELSQHPDLTDGLHYTITFGNQVYQSSLTLRHRDILNPVFNETLEFLPCDSNKLVFRLYSHGVLLGEADILLASNKCLAYIVTRKRAILGSVYYSLTFCQITKDIMKHTRGAESQNYTGYAYPSSIIRNKPRDKSQELRPKDSRPRNVAEIAYSPQLSDELFSNYFQKKSDAHFRQPSDEPQMTVSIDPRDRQMQNKKKMLEQQLKETENKLEQTRQARRVIAQKMSAINRQFEQLKNQDQQLEPMPSAIDQILSQLNATTAYNTQLRKKIQFLIKKQ